MKEQKRSRIKCLSVMASVLVVGYALLGTVTAQTAAEKAYRDATFSCLNKSKYIWESNYGNWVDRKTGKIVSSKEVGEAWESVKKDITDPNRAHDAKSGDNFFWDGKTKTWKDAKTGESRTPA